MAAAGRNSAFGQTSKPWCAHTVKAEVAAFEEVFYYNRFGSFNPAGLMYALRRDLVPIDASQKLGPGNVRLREDKRPRPLVLRVNEEDCLEVTFWNYLSPQPPIQFPVMVPQHALAPPNKETRLVPYPSPDSDYPATRAASMHVNSLDYVPLEQDASTCRQNLGSFPSDGAFVGQNDSSLVRPGECTTYRWYAKREGGYFLFSTAANSGGEGDGGQVGLGLFGAINVEPKGSVWYRSQVTHEQLKKSVSKADDYLNIDYDDPSITMVDPKTGSINHSDLNAIIYQQARAGKKQNGSGEYCIDAPPSSKCGAPFREFTVIFHDELTAVQAFAELADEQNPISSVKDGMGINYGTAGMGAPVLANLKQLGPGKNCAECKFEEFFLTSWVNGDPSMIVEREASGQAKRALYPDDPSNVHHSYIGDPVRFRNIHAGPKETHVFHLHAHQWLLDKNDANSTYLDSQTISPGASYTYDIEYGGSGNRNATVGDSIFHCHLYPHFAQGMWELWRSHDTFEDGTKGVWTGSHPRGRALPDAEISDGTPTPAVLPIPGRALPPLPSATFGGYPFFMPALAGHRPPQPPLDMDVWKQTINGSATEEETNGGLPRHVVIDGEAANGDKLSKEELFKAGGKLPEYIAHRVDARNSNLNLTLFAKELKKATIKVLPADGTESEKVAMRYHSGDLQLDFWGAPAGSVETHTPRDEFPGDSRDWWKGKGYRTMREHLPGAAPALTPGLFVVNGNGMRINSAIPSERKYGYAGAPYSNPCPAGAPERTYRAAYIQFDLTVNKYGWHDPQGRIAVLEQDIRDTLNYRRPAEPLFFRANSGECITFKATNLMPSRLNLDDFQIYSPTDVIGQHIHLVKFDVTSSDGSANGWNYEDGTLSADEVRERIGAHHKQNPGSSLHLKTHPIFKTGNAMAGDRRGWCADMPGGSDLNLWCGAQTSVQRWYADPLLNLKNEDRTIRTVFTHDHFSPSSHQHHGLYSALVVEPKNSRWMHLDGTVMGGSDKQGQPMAVRKDGGPTSYAANIIPPEAAKSKREFNLAFADFSLLYTADLRPVNPPNRDEELLFPGGIENDLIPQPEGISGGDPGSQLINYRSEPMPLRVGEPVQDSDQYQQKRGENGKVTAEGNLANVFSSTVHEEDGKKLQHTKPVQADEEAGDATKLELMKQVEAQRLQFNNFHLNEPWRKAGDPGTPLIAAYEGDPVQIRLIQGAQEEQHIFSTQGLKWLFQLSSKDSGWMNAQQIGISEHMEFNSIVPTDNSEVRDYLYESTSVDDIWDGMWGLMRVFSKDRPGLSRLPETIVKPLPNQFADVAHSACQPEDFNKRKIWYVGAWRASDLLNGKPLSYNERFGIKDLNAIVFVQQAALSVDGKTKEAQDSIPGLSAGDMADRGMVLAKLRQAYANGKVLEPLILRATAGDCMEVHLFNYLDPKDFDDAWHFDRSFPKNAKGSSYNMVPPIVEGLGFNQLESSASVGLTPQLAAFSVRDSAGSNVGVNDNSLVPPCPSDKPNCGNNNRLYFWYAGDQRLDSKGKITYHPAEFGAVNLQDSGDVIKHPAHGAIGALIIEPKGTTHAYAEQHPLRRGTIIAEPFYRSRGAADIIDPKSNTVQFRDFALLYQDALGLHRYGMPLENLRGGDDAEDSGSKAFNYRTEPLWARAGFINPSISPEESSNTDFSNILSSKAANPGCHGACGDPATPLFTAQPGMEVRFRVLHPGGHSRQHGFTLFGHNWELMPWQSSAKEQSDKMGWNRHSPLVGSASGIGPLRHVNVLTCAGGEFGVEGDYLYRTQESFQYQGGLWGIFEVKKAKGENGNVRKDCRVPGYRSH